MSDAIIQVENLSKKYVISHQQKGSNDTFRDVIANTAKSLTKSIGLGGKSKSKFEDASKEEFWALKDVSFEINQGDRVGIIGRNGAGKSTLLKILSRITEPTSGKVRIKGRVASLLEVGTGFHGELTGRENIYLNGAILGMSKAEIQRKFDEIVAFSEVEQFLDTPVKRYSSGMYVRLAFAVAAHLEPEILIVDEVLAVGDIQFQKKCLEKMGQVASEGRTVFCVSHNMASISALCDKVLYLKSGCLHALGETEKIIGIYFSDTLKSTDKNLDDLRLPGFGKEIRFTDIELINEESSLLFNQPIKYRITISSKIDANDLSIGSSFFDNSGKNIGTLITEKFKVKANNEVTLILTVNATNLAPGSYYAGFSVGYGEQQGTRRDCDIVVGIPKFSIVPASDDDIRLMGWHVNWGSIFFSDIHLSLEEEYQSKLNSRLLSNS